MEAGEVSVISKAANKNLLDGYGFLGRGLCHAGDLGQTSGH